MTSKTEQVLAALKTLIELALPGAKVERNQDKPDRETPGGIVNILDGEPEETSVDFNPPTYNYQHEIPVEVVGFKSASITADAAAKSMMATIGQAVQANPFLGGLCDFIRVTAPDTDNVTAEGSHTARGGKFAVIATYSTSSPLG